MFFSFLYYNGGMKKIFILLFLCFFSCTSSDHSLLIIPQWHLEPHINTNISDFDKTKYKQNTNQKDIYLYLSKKIEKKEITTLIAEGCEGEITERYKYAFNGWDYNSLYSQKHQKSFEDILTSVALKLKVKYPKLKVICGDNRSLIQQNLQIFRRLDLLTASLFEKDNKRLSQLRSYYPNVGDVNNKSILKGILKDEVKKLEVIIQKRNESFFSQLKSNGKKTALVVGLIHVRGIESLLKSEQIEFQHYTPEGLNEQDASLINDFKKMIDGIKKKIVVLFQMPNQFKLTSFPFKENVKFKDILNKKESKELQRLLKDNEMNEGILFSDYDQDGIRDFTISQGGGKLVISAEDNDWDNDGVVNLLDKTVGEIQIATIAKNQHIQNNFILRNTKAIDEKNKLSRRGIALTNEGQNRHDLLVLSIFNKILDSLPQSVFSVKTFSATTPKVSFGSKVFFSYIEQSQSIEFYPTKFYEYLLKQRKKRFAQATDSVFVNKFVSLVILHSLSHELAHSLKIEKKGFEELGLTWTEKKVTSTYLQKFRNPVKVLNVIKNNFEFQKTSFLEIQKKFNSYQKDVKELYKDKPRLDQAKKSSWYSGIEGDSEYWLSFLAHHHIPSLYAMTNEKEWFAEMFSACFFQKVKSNLDKKEGIRLEKLIGLYPLGTPKGFCKKYL